MNTNEKKPDLQELLMKYSPKDWRLYMYAGTDEEGRDKIKTWNEYIVDSNEELVDTLMKEIKDYNLKEEEVFNLDNWRWQRDYDKGFQAMWIKLGEHWITIGTGLDIADREHIRNLPPLYIQTMLGPLMVGVVGL